MRGYSAIALFSPKDWNNIGGVLRIAGNFKSSLIVIGRERANIRHPADTMKAYRSVPTIRTDDIMSAIPYDCVPIAVDLLPNAKPLHEFKHPERAFYIFGPEDGTLGKSITDKCAFSVFVDTNRCMNLAVTVGIVLYDRYVKQLGRA